MKRTLPMASLIILALHLIFSGTLQAQMIADIQQDVPTEFGVYHPYLVTITPNAAPYTVAPDFSNVVNFSDFHFTEAEKSLLAQNYFVVSPRRETGGTGYREIYDIYNECRELGIPIFVTTDAMLHTFHLCFDNILKICEEQKFFADLNNLLLALLDETQNQYAATSDSSVRQALLTNLNYLIVAEKLLDSIYVEPINGGPYLQELELIRQHEGFVPSPIFQYAEDYSQYIVRGHYTKSDTLRHYFLSMMWLGRMTFDRTDPQFTLSAILLTQAMEKLIINGEPALEVWDRIYTPTVFLVGKSDDINLLQYRPIAHQIYGENFATLPPDDFADKIKLDAFMAQAVLLPGPKITYPGQPAGFRLMGQRFIPDSYILDELVFNKIPDLRFMPKGLDIMAVLGSERALELLRQTPDWTLYPSYPVKLDSLRHEFDNYPDEIWAQNVYWNWLYSLMPLLFPKGEGYPPFMQKPAWMDKDLLAALASWAELRHDTILYAKQSGTETGIIPPSIEEQGYVEPNPHLYARLASLAAFLREGLANRGLLFDRFATALTKFHDLMVSLKEISEKELTGRSLSGEDYLLICDIGRIIQSIVEFAQHEWETTGPLPDSEDAMPVIADVHTDANSGLVLEEGVGYPYCIYVIASVEGQLKVTKGAGFSYYEFTWPQSDRLTDEKWREMLTQENVPGRPQWTASFMDIDQTWVNRDPQFYYWRKHEIQSLVVSVKPDSPRVGDSVTITVVTSPPIAGCSVSILFTYPDSTSFNKNIVTDAAGKATFVLSQSTIAGRYWVEVSAFGTVYRTSFIIFPKTGIAEHSRGELPQRFQLHPNYPNPFNATTVIRYDLPAPGFVTLEIYNLLGQKVRTLVAERRPAGSYQTLWDGTDDAGVVLPTGVYMARLQSHHSVQLRKIILLR
ncbi:MAG: DUF3160 domain-containing protein [candidate division KSB1 bacterium]|nr:DUF3160 domain-containing protein [candidate division KSB1 bacterium]